MTNDERMTKSELTTPMARPRKELAARSCELGDARDESSNPSARCAHALPKVLRASSFGFPLSFVIRIRHSSYSRDSRVKSISSVTILAVRGSNA